MIFLAFQPVFIALPPQFFARVYFLRISACACGRIGNLKNFSLCK